MFDCFQWIEFDCIQLSLITEHLIGYTRGLCKSPFPYPLLTATYTFYNFLNIAPRTIMYVYYTIQFLNKVMKILEHHQERLFLTACSWLKESANKMGEIELSDLTEVS